MHSRSCVRRGEDLLPGMEAFVIVVLGLAVMAGIIGLSVRAHRKGLENLAALAGRLGLQVVRGQRLLGLDQHRLEGRWQGRHVRFWTYSTGAGKSRRQWIVAGVETPAAGDVAFELRGQGVLTKISEFFGAKEIRVGEARFDAEWFITTNRPVEFAAALVPEIRQKLAAVRAAGAAGVFTRQDGWVCYVEQGSFSRAPALGRLESALPVLVDLADVADVCAKGVRA